MSEIKLIFQRCYVRQTKTTRLFLDKTAVERLGSIKLTGNKLHRIAFMLCSYQIRYMVKVGPGHEKAFYSTTVRWLIDFLACFGVL